jgi:hypothetical protein
MLLGIVAYFLLVMFCLGESLNRRLADEPSVRGEGKDGRVQGVSLNAFNVATTPTAGWQLFADPSRSNHFHGEIMMPSWSQYLPQCEQITKAENR